MQVTAIEPAIEKEKLVQIYRAMLLIRAFEERVGEMYMAGQLPFRGHLYTGQEAVGAGALAAVNDDDIVTTNHRGHGHAIARTRDLKSVMAELCGKTTGFARGKSGPMHMSDFDKGMLGGFAIIGESITMAVGAALAARNLGNGRVAVAFFGEGGSNEGAFHEGLNLAAIWDLPVIFICENNKYGVYSSVENVMRVKNVADRASAYGMPGAVVDGNDALAVYRTVHEAADRARAGLGPTLIEAKTYRWGGHNTADPGTGYRPRGEIEEWKRKDPIPRYRGYLLEAGVLTESDAQEMQAEVNRQMEEAVHFGLSSPNPDASEAFADLFAPEYRPFITESSGEVRQLTAIQALNEGLREEMEREPRLTVLGYDVSSRGGSYGVTKGLADLFGTNRVIDTPISEIGYMGAAVGAALAGVPTLVELGQIDFMPVAMDPIVNVAAKWRYMSAGKMTVPLVMNISQGGGTCAAATHSQSLESWFTHIPGLKVVLPATPYDCKGMLKTALRDPNPVIFINHRMLYREKGPVPAGEYAIPFGKAALRRRGRDVTVVALAAMVGKALAAAETLAREGIEIEVIDPRSLVPFDVDMVADSVQRTGRLVVIQESPLCSSFGTEIARVIGKAAFDYLEAPIEVIGTTVPLPFSPVLEPIVIPSERDLIRAVRTVLGHS